MRRFLKSAMLFAIVSAFATGCSKDITEDVSGGVPEVKRVSVSATAYTPAEDGSSRTEFGELTSDGKTYPFYWSTDTEETIFVGEILNEATGNIHYKRGENITSAILAVQSNKKKATTEISKPENSTGGNYHVVYPVSSVSDMYFDEAMGKVIYIDFPRYQTMPKANQIDPAGTILYAKYEDTDGSATSFEFGFKHLAAYGEMTVKNFKVEDAADDEMIKEVRLIVKNEVTEDIPHKISGQLFYYLDGTSKPSQDSEYLDYPTQYSDVVVNVEALNLKASDAGDFVVIFAAIPDKDIKDFSLRITTTKGRTFRRGVAIPEGKNLLTFNVGRIKAFSVDMATAEEYGAGSGNAYTKITNLSEVTPGDYIFVVQNGTNYYTLNNGVKTSLPATDISDTELIVDETTISGITSEYSWNLTGTADEMYVKAESAYLTCNGTSATSLVIINNPSVPKTWAFSESTTKNGCFYMVIKNNDSKDRYLSIRKESNDWRIYDKPNYTTAGSGATTAISEIILFKKGSNDGPVILADDINTLSPNGNDNGTFSYDISGFSDNDVKVEITDYDGNISYAIIYEDTKEVYYILEPNYSTDEVISEIGLTATADNGESAVLRVKIKQSAAKPLTVTPSEIVVYGNTKQTITVSSPEYDINVKAYSDDTPGSVTVNKDSFAAGNSIEIELNIELEPDNDDVVGYVAIWRKGDSERNAVKVAVLTGEGEIDAPELREVSATPSRLTATWTECTLADGYEWAVVAKNGNPDNDAIESGKVEGNNASVGIITLTAEITMLSAGEEYDFYVRAIQAGGLSSWSDAKTFSLGADPYDGKKFVIVTNYTGTSSYVDKGYNAVSSQLVNNRLSRVALNWSSVPEIYNPTTSDIVWTVTKSQNSGYYYFANAEGQYLATSSNNQAAFNPTGTDFEIKKSDTGDNTVTLHSGSYHLWLNHNTGVFGLSSTVGNITDVYLVPVGEVVEPDPEQPEQPEQPSGGVDVLNNAFTGVTGSSYTGWSGKGTSGAVYAGFSAGQYSSIQLRVTNKNEGVVTTSSGGKVAKMSVKWNENTLPDRTLEVYCKNTAYESPADLFDTGKQGTKVVSFQCAAGNQELTIPEGYTYIGFRSSASALYLDEVKITWE